MRNVNDARRAGARAARMLGTSVLAAACAALLGLGASLAACESAANLDVTYGDASAALESGATGDGEAVDGGEGGPAVLVSGTIAGCPCDPTQGLGCCMPAAGNPFCTVDTAVCAMAKGTHLKCVRPDPSSESTCCWHGSGAGAVTALAAVCKDGPTACSVDTDCAGTGETKCAIAVCFNGTIAVGACGSVPPICPQP
jgi:hypothetical protein